MKGAVRMGEYIVMAGFLLIFFWGWRRVYLHILRKKGRPLIAHMLGLLLSLFPARFFVYAAFAIAPPEGAEPISDGKTFLLCCLFIASMVALCVLTRKRTVKINSLPAGTAPEEENRD